MSRILMPSALALAIFAVSNAQAADVNQTTQSSQALPVIVVTASKTPEAIEKVPARISVIDEKTIQQSPANDLPHLLQQQAALNVVQTGGYGAQTSIFTRGVNSNHTLVLKDGVRLNTGLDGSSSSPFLDLTDVRKIEVLKGPASVQYGSDAIGGVIQLVSDQPKKQKLFTTVEAGDANTYKAIVGADLVENDAYFQIRGQRLESDGTPVIDAPNTKDSSYDQKGYNAKGGINNDLYAIEAQFSENKGTNEYIGGVQDFFNRLINLKGRYTINDQFTVSARTSQFEDELTQKLSTSYFNTKRIEGDLNLQWSFTKNQNILIGANSASTDVESLSISPNSKNMDTIGYYLQHQFKTDIYSTQAGIRVEDNEQFGTHTVGQLAGRIQVAPKTSIYANVGSAFKAPTANQLYYKSSYIYDGVTYSTFGNPNLKPEESISYELGFDHKFTDGLTTYASVYQTKIKNLIDYVSGFPDSTYNNVSKAKLTGGELGLKWQKDAWFASTGYGYVKPKNDITDKELTRRPRQTGTLSFGWDNSIYGANISLIAKSKAKEFDANHPTPGFVTANLNTYWQVNPNIRLFGNIRNIGDTKYKTALYGTYPSATYYIAAPLMATAGITLSY